MIKKLPVKPAYLLIIGTVVFAIICYRFAFRQTIEAWQQNSKYQQQLANGSNLSYDPAYLGRKAANIDKVINLYRTDTSAFRNIIVNKISLLAEKENVKLTELPSFDPVYSTDQITMQKIVLTGDYFALLKVMDKLEKTAEIGVVNAWAIRSQGKEVEMTHSALVLELYLQTVK